MEKAVNEQLLHTDLVLAQLASGNFTGPVSHPVKSLLSHKMIQLAKCIFFPGPIQERKGTQLCPTPYQRTVCKPRIIGPESAFSLDTSCPVVYRGLWQHVLYAYAPSLLHQILDLVQCRFLIL